MRVSLLLASVGLWAGWLAAGMAGTGPGPLPVSAPGIGAEQALSAPGNIVRFKNGDRLHGRVLSIDGAKCMRLACPDITEVLELSCEDVARIVLTPGKPGRGQAVPMARLQFVNGDVLVGELERLEADKIVVNTWYAGSLNLPRDKLQTIHLLQAEEALYTGPTGLEGWVVSDSLEGAAGEAWAYQDGVFYSKNAGGIAREVHLPDMASIDLDVAWRDFLQLTITIYTESLKVYQLGGSIRGVDGLILNVAPPAQEGAGFYAVQINRNTTYLLTVRKDGQVINSPMEIVAGLERATRVRLGVRADKKRKTISLLIDGQLVKTWKEAGEFAGQGTAVRFVHQGQTLVNLSNIRVSTWDGVLETPAGPALKSAQDLVHLRNQDTLSGTLEGVRDGKIGFTTSFGTVEIPLERVARVQVAGRGETKEKPAAGLVRAQLVQGGTLTFKLESWAQNRLVATSPMFGQATFEAAAFEFLEFE